jgi:GNAT superfamily N-acetyltransferase
VSFNRLSPTGPWTPLGLAAALSRLAWLKDGSSVVLRPISPADRGRIEALVGRLSDYSKSLRFLRQVGQLSGEELDYLTDVDHRDHEALVAVDPFSREVRGVARFVRFADDPEVAEAAVVVEDSWQGRGLGRLLLDDLAIRARWAGIRRFSLLMRAENLRAAELFERVGPVVSRDVGPDGVLEFEVELPAQGGAGAELARTLALAAAQSVVCLFDVMTPPFYRSQRRRSLS